jgi:integrase
LKARDEKATRRVDLPDELVPVLEDHLKQFVGTQPNAWLFEDPDKGLLARSQFRLLLDKAKEVTGLDDVTFHVLRHTGATWFAEEGATVREVMERLGHRSERMAMRYQHAATERMRQLAYGMGGRLGGRLGTASEAKSEAEAS